jgi:hypothetical protein
MASFVIAVLFSGCPSRIALNHQVTMAVKQNPPTRTELSVMLAYRSGSHKDNFDESLRLLSADLSQMWFFLRS